MNFPKIFCVTTKENVLRKKYVKEHFTSQSLEFEFFEGIDGEKFGLKTKICYNDLYGRPEGTYDITPYYITSGHIGCILSHYMLWKTLSYLPYDEILIFEDDVSLCHDFKNKFINFKNQLPINWEYVFVGSYYHTEDYVTVTDNIFSYKIPPLTTHAYMIKKSIIPILLETNHMAWAHIDIQIQKKSLPYLKHYTFNPSLANQLSIENNENEFKSLTKYERYV